jgi:hypothetical protein
VRRTRTAATWYLVSGMINSANLVNDNQKQFTGIFSRYLADLASATGTTGYRQFAQRRSDATWTGTGTSSTRSDSAGRAAARTSSTGAQASGLGAITTAQ